MGRAARAVRVSSCPQAPPCLLLCAGPPKREPRGSLVLGLLAPALASQRPHHTICPQGPHVRASAAARPLSGTSFMARPSHQSAVLSPRGLSCCWPLVDTVGSAELRVPSRGGPRPCACRGGLCELDCGAGFGEESELPLRAELGMWVLAEGCPAVWPLRWHCSGGISLSSHTACTGNTVASSSSHSARSSPQRTVLFLWFPTGGLLIV